MLKNNLFYFEYSLKNPEPIWDKDFYPFLQKTINSSEYKNIVEMEKYISKISSRATNSEAEGLLKFLIKNGCEKSYFSFFLRTCDLSVAELTDERYYREKDRISAIKNVLEIYIKERKNPKTDKNSLQAYNDAQTAKRRSSTGEDKLIILSGLKVTKDPSDLKNKIAKISKTSGPFQMKKIKKLFNVEFKFSKADKVPDYIFMIGKKVFIVEAKHVNGQGGAQNGSISELVSILKLKEKNSDINYIAFLDGCYTKYLTVSDENKSGTQLEKQRYRIKETLSENKNNYFLNTVGFIKFMKDLQKAKIT
jgi:hypothetical protein